MAITNQNPSDSIMREAALCSKDLLAADDVLQKVAKALAAHYKGVGGHDHPREWMQEHINRRGAIQKAREVLIDMAEAANVKL